MFGHTGWGNRSTEMDVCQTLLLTKLRDVGGLIRDHPSPTGKMMFLHHSSRAFLKADNTLSGKVEKFFSHF